jgi:imidazole glycerol-phosphate synthase subunit HisF
MLKRRLIPVLFLKDGWMVRSESFKYHQVMGHPVHHVERLAQWDVDELIVLDISTGEACFDFARDDYRHAGPKDLLEFIQMTATECHIPLTFGGRIRNFEDIQLRIRNGADKVVLNTAIAETPELVSETARVFGRQAIVANVDYRETEDGPIVFTHHGSVSTGTSVVDWAQRVVDLGAGEIFLHAIDRDGIARGYDLETIASATDAVNIPIICCGGAGHQSHFMRCCETTDASGIAAGNIFHFTENAYPAAKKYLRKKRDDIR